MSKKLYFNVDEYEQVAVDERVVREIARRVKEGLLITFSDVTTHPTETIVGSEDQKEIRIVIHDGWAAGGSWLLVEFKDGPLAGHTVWMNDNDQTAVYFGHQVDDGYLFNPDPSREVPPDVDVVPGGEYVLGHTFGFTIWLG